MLVNQYLNELQARTSKRYYHARTSCASAVATCDFLFTAYLIIVSNSKIIILTT